MSTNLYIIYSSGMFRKITFTEWNYFWEVYCQLPCCLLGQLMLAPLSFYKGFKTTTLIFSKDFRSLLEKFTFSVENNNQVSSIKKTPLNIFDSACFPRTVYDRNCEKQSVEIWCLMLPRSLALPRKLSVQE